MGLFSKFKKEDKEQSLRNKYLRRFFLITEMASSDEELFTDIENTRSRFEHAPELNGKVAKEIDDQIYALIDSLYKTMDTVKSEARSQAAHRTLFKIDNLLQERKGLAKEFDVSPKTDFVIENGVLTSYVGNGGDVVVPSEVEVIAEKAFYHNMSIRSLILQEGVKVIHDEAFYLCKALTYVRLPSTLTRVGQSAFYSCKALETVDIKNGLTTIDYYAFGRCVALKQINIPKTVKDIKDKAFTEDKELPRAIKKQIKDINSRALD